MPTLTEPGFARNAYDREVVEASSLGFATDAPVTVERLIPGSAALNAETAHFRFGYFGAVALSPDFKLPKTGQPLSELVDPLIADFVDHTRQHIDNPDIIGTKEFESPEYGTLRRMRNVAYPKVKTEFPEAIDFQHSVLDAVRAINGDRGTMVSTDPDEGTVGNFQVYDLNGDPNAFQEHGAHNDRVDTTVVACMDNVGPNGELVFVEGYDKACANLGLDPFHGFKETVLEILSELPNSLTFRAHTVSKGDLIVIKSAENIHFITPKTLGNVLEGVHKGQKPIDLKSQKEPGLVLGRAIINMAFESEQCRKDDGLARALEGLHLQRTGKHFNTKTAAFYKQLDRLAGQSGIDKIPDWQTRARAKVINAIINRGTAHRLYLQSDPTKV